MDDDCGCRRRRSDRQGSADGAARRAHRAAKPIGRSRDSLWGAPRARCGRRADWTRRRFRPARPNARRVRRAVRRELRRRRPRGRGDPPVRGAGHRRGTSRGRGRRFHGNARRSNAVDGSAIAGADDHGVSARARHDQRQLPVPLASIESRLGRDRFSVVLCRDVPVDRAPGDTRGPRGGRRGADWNPAPRLLVPRDRVRPGAAGRQPVERGAVCPAARRVLCGNRRRADRDRGSRSASRGSRKRARAVVDCRQRGAVPLVGGIRRAVGRNRRTSRHVGVLRVSDWRDRGIVDPADGGRAARFLR